MPKARDEGVRALERQKDQLLYKLDGLMTASVRVAMLRALMPLLREDLAKRGDPELANLIEAFDALDSVSQAAAEPVKPA